MYTIFYITFLLLTLCDIIYLFYVLHITICIWQTCELLHIKEFYKHKSTHTFQVDVYLLVWIRLRPQPRCAATHETGCEIQKHTLDAVREKTRHAVSSDCIYSDTFYHLVLMGWVGSEQPPRGGTYNSCWLSWFRPTAVYVFARLNWVEQELRLVQLQIALFYWWYRLLVPWSHSKFPQKKYIYIERERERDRTTKAFDQKLKFLGRD